MYGFKTLLGITFLSILPHVIAHADEPRLSTPSGVRPSIVFKHQEFDFGNRISGDRLTHRFPFKNNGDTTLIIEKTESTCSCTAAVTTSETIHPGRSGSIEVIFETGMRKGPSEQSIQVFSNDPISPIVTLLLKANLLVYLDADPSDLNLGKILPGATTEKRIRLGGLDIDDVSIDQITIPNHDVYNASIVQVEDLRLQKQPWIEICYSLDGSRMPPGRFRSNLRIECSGSRVPFIEIGLTGEIMTPVCASPVQIELTRSDFSSGKVIHVLISSNDGKAFTIDSIQCDPVTIDASWSPGKPSSNHTLRILIPGNSLDIGQRAWIECRIDHPEQKLVRVPVISLPGLDQGGIGQGAPRDMAIEY